MVTRSHSKNERASGTPLGTSLLTAIANAVSNPPFELSQKKRSRDDISEESEEGTEEGTRPAKVYATQPERTPRTEKEKKIAKRYGMQLKHALLTACPRLLKNYEKSIDGIDPEDVKYTEEEWRKFLAGEESDDDEENEEEDEDEDVTFESNLASLVKLSPERYLDVPHLRLARRTSALWYMLHGCLSLVDPSLYQSKYRNLMDIGLKLTEDS
jgi:hypothetical protein